MAVYVDTSAFAKRYLSERGSEEFDEFLRSCDDECWISPLGATEFESILQRLKRRGVIDAGYVRQARGDFHGDLAASLWSMRPFEPSSFHQAAALLRTLDVPLATLDALHLATAIDFGCDGFATGDRQLARAAAKRGLRVHDFVI